MTMHGLTPSSLAAEHHRTGSATSTGVPKVGDKAPDFTLPLSTGGDFHLADALGKNNIVIFFYPKDQSPICTAEACSFRDAYDQFKQQGAEVVGISSDAAESHKLFAAKHHLPFIMVSDEKQKVRSLYHVPKTGGMVPGRVTYVIDKEGTIKLIFNSQLNASKHVEEALRVLKQSP